jgi:hypothetical protein
VISSAVWACLVLSPTTLHLVSSVLSSHSTLQLSIMSGHQVDATL